MLSPPPLLLGWVGVGGKLQGFDGAQFGGEYPDMNTIRPGLLSLQCTDDGVIRGLLHKPAEVVLISGPC